MIVKNMHGGRDATPNYLIVHSMTYDILLARNSHLALSALPELPEHPRKATRQPSNLEPFWASH